MPILPENRNRYPDNWTEISYRIRFERAKGICEGCGAVHGQPHPETGSKVILTTAHLDHCPENCAEDNLAAYCQKCHNAHDAPHRAQTRRIRRDKANGQRYLIPDANPALDR